MMIGFIAISERAVMLMKIPLIGQVQSYTKQGKVAGGWDRGFRGHFIAVGERVVMVVVVKS